MKVETVKVRSGVWDLTTWLVALALWAGVFWCVIQAARDEQAAKIARMNH